MSSVRLKGVLALAVATITSLVACSGAGAPSRTPAAVDCPDGGTPEGIVACFYSEVIALRPAGLPSAAQQRRLAPYLSRRLVDLRDAARDHQADFARRFPDEKPPFVGGSLFVSLFEGANRFEVLRSEAARTLAREGGGAGEVLAQADGGTRVVVRFWYEEGVDPWEDSAVVVRDGDRIVIDELVFSGAGDFNPPGKLSEILASREE